MREIVLAFFAIAAISTGAYFALQEVGFSAAERGSGDAVRLGE